MLNPYGEVIREVRGLLNALGRELGEDLGNYVSSIMRAPPQYGYIAVPLHGLVKKYGDLSNALNRALNSLSLNLLDRVVIVNGYLNIDVKPGNYAQLVLNTITRLGDKYGATEECPRGVYIIEHTSANPAKPMHIGHGRNAVLGDSLARLLRFCGASVRTHFYVNDCGDQVPYVGIGYYVAKDVILRRINEGRKPDEVFGIVYTVTYSVGEVKRLTKQIERLSSEGKYEEANKLISERDEWLSSIRNASDKDKELTDALLMGLSKYDDVALMAKQWARAYEEGDEFVRRVIREAVDLILGGFRETLNRLGITFDSWDFESEVAVDNKGTYRVINELIRNAQNYVERSDGALVFRADRVAEDLGLWDELNIPRYIPRATLLRSDGTSLYLTRDIAYALWYWDNFKFDKLIRVIGSEQAHPQAQLRLALYVMGYRELAKKIIHYSYEMVNLAGMKMSGRKGVYVSLDELIDEAKSRILSIIKDRFPPNEAGPVAEAVAVGAIRYSFLSVSPNKPLTFSWDRVLDLRQNSGPFIQYTYVRANSIIEKAGQVPSLVVPSDIKPEEKELILMLGEFPSIITKAAQELRIEYITEYVNKLSLLFNSYYEKYPVLNAPQGQREFRLNLVSAVRTVLGNAMDIMGIPRLRRM
ncbi:arginine--tRNA ligase [Vulcanisaeta thermophila]|uniref:arginine--tRNA ligase n=1 Tax=Vulcanisaeta thermophila TaxID=867917 RepID=UPI000853E512|nr:arginine--tRNA ligase [Vulcanisaeta thermophila]